jgi:ABC-type lipoprotein export system ATPase subunit
MSVSLRIEELMKCFDGPRGTVRALGGVSLTAAPGEFVAVQGPSGSGKTTLLLAAGGLLRPTGGRVQIDGEDPYALAPSRRAAWRARTIGFVFQQFHLIPYLSVLENVLAPSIAMPSRAAAERARALVSGLGLADRGAHVPAALSTGERQRVALARALLNRPGLLLADEPTGNLDRDNAALVLDSLHRFAGDGGTVLLVTHDPAAAGCAHRTLHLRDGILTDR